MSSITSKGLLVGIYTDWPIDLNLSTLLKDWYNLANFYFKKKKPLGINCWDFRGYEQSLIDFSPPPQIFLVTREFIKN